MMASDMVSVDTQRLVLEAVVKDLEPKYLMDYLYQESAISEDEMEILGNTVTRKERCRVLLSQLNQRPNPRKNFDIFAKALASDYSFLTANVRAILDQDPLSAVSRAIPENAINLSLVDEICLNILPPAGGGLRSCKDASRLFDRLSSLLNGGKIDTFNDTCRSILQRQSVNTDVKCVVKYLQACRFNFAGNFSSGLKTIREGKEFCQSSSSPVQYLLYFLSCQCWVYITATNYSKLDSCLSDAEQMILTNKLLCRGMASGWIFLDRAKYILPLLNGKEPDKSTRLITRACSLMDQAIEQFQLEKSKDGPFGFTYALIIKAIILLRCGALMNTVKLSVPQNDVKEAAGLLATADSSEIGLPAMLKPSYYIAMADLNFRRDAIQRAEEYAQQALEASETINNPDLIKQATARVNLLRVVNERQFERQNIVGPFQETLNSKALVKTKREHDNSYMVLNFDLRVPRFLLAFFLFSVILIHFLFY